MCLMCQEEDLYFLYLEQRERAQQRERGETAPADPNWLWPSFVTASASAIPVSQAPPERAADRKSGFTCDAAE
jgi:hypothetical protein